MNGFAGKIATSVFNRPPVLAIVDLGGVSAIAWFAIGSLFTMSNESAAQATATSRDRRVAGLVLFLSFLPLNFAAAIGLLLCGLYLAATSWSDAIEGRLATVMIALTGPLIWGRFLLALMGPFLLGLDAQMAGLLAGASVQGNVVAMRDGGSLYVALGCSSVHNMSLAVLLFVTLTQRLRLRYTPLLVATGIGAALSMTAVNVLRLAALARFPQHFDLIHTGWGGTMFGLISFVAAGAVIIGGIRAEQSR